MDGGQRNWWLMYITLKGKAIAAGGRDSAVRLACSQDKPLAPTTSHLNKIPAPCTFQPA